ncbi:SMR family transporter [Roseburia hominis]
MLYLGLAIIASALVSTVMRLSEGKVKNNMGMFVANYAACSFLSLLFMDNLDFGRAEAKAGIAACLGVFSGVLYLTSFVLLQQNIRKNGVVLAATFMKLGVLIPTLMAIIVFREQPEFFQVLGIGLAIAAIIIIHFEKENVEASKYQFLLIVLLLVSGFTDSMANIYDKLGSTELKDHYLLFTFLAAGVCAFVLWIKERQKLCVWDVLAGVCIGIPNYFSSRFLLLALHHLPAVIVYPAYSVVTIVVISVVGVVLFKEKLSRKKLAAIALIFLALALLNL